MLNESQPKKSAYQSLTAKQKAFVTAICADPNISATAAALKAGYKEAGARVEGHRLLTNANIRKAFGEKLKDAGPSTEEIAHRWDRVSRATLDDFYTEVEYEERTTIQQPLAEAIAQLREEFEFDKEYTYRSAEMLGLTGDELSDYCKDLEKQEMRLKLDILRYEMRLEKDPAAFRLIDGPKVKKVRLDLDLVKAQRLGVLDLAKSIKPTANGLGIEIRDPDAALDKLARIKGAYEKDNEQSRAVPVINTKVEIIRTGPPIARSEKDIDDV